MIKKVRIIRLIALICVLLISLTGCYDSTEVDDITYVTAIGIDKAKTNNLKMTLQYAVPKNFGASSGGSGGGSGGQQSTDLISVECPTMYAGLNMANGFLGKRLDLTHAKVIVFSEKFAKEGLAKYIYGITRIRSFRPNMYVAVSNGPAEDYIKSIKPIQEFDPVKYYELNYSAYKYTGFTGPTYLSTFYNAMVGGFQSPIATLAAVGKQGKGNSFKLSDSTYRRKGRKKPYEGDYYAGNLPKTGDIKSEIFGLAAFNGDKMVGKFDGEESTDYLMITGKFGYANFSVPDPIKKGYSAVVIMKLARKPIINLKMKKGKTSIFVLISAEGDIASIQSGINYETTDKLKIFEKSVDKMFNLEIKQFLERTKKLNVDICGFGNLAKSKFFTWKSWEDYKWLSKYKNVKFKVDFKFRVRRTGLKTETEPIISSSGKQKRVN